MNNRRNQTEPRKIIADFCIFAGFTSICSGITLQFGIDAGLICAGCEALLFGGMLYKS